MRILDNGVCVIVDQAILRVNSVFLFTVVVVGVDIWVAGLVERSVCDCV